MKSKAAKKAAKAKRKQLRVERKAKLRSKSKPIRKQRTRVSKPSRKTSTSRRPATRRPTKRTKRKPVIKLAAKAKQAKAPPIIKLTRAQRKALEILPARLRKAALAEFKRPPPKRSAAHKLTPAERAALDTLDPQTRDKVVAVIAKESRRVRAKSIQAKKEAKAKAAETRAKAQAKQTDRAKAELAQGVRLAEKKGGKLYGYNPLTKTEQKTKGTFAGFRRIPFEDRADYKKEELKRKYAEWRRDVLIQSVHVREYMSLGDGGDGRRAIVEKVRNAGLKMIDTKLKDKSGKPIRVYQMCISTIRVLIRKADVATYGGYATHPIGSSKSKYVTDIRGLEGFETVQEWESPKAAFDRLLDRLDNHLDVIRDGISVIYIKSLQIKFDVQAE